MFEALLSNRTVGVLVEALPDILTAGLTMTIHDPSLLLFAMLIAVAVALLQYANVPVLRQIAQFYVGHPGHPLCWCSCSSSFTACPAWASC